jgi:hypothetical protein
MEITEIIPIVITLAMWVWSLRKPMEHSDYAFDVVWVMKQALALSVTLFVWLIWALLK